jgi:ATP-dependent helicase/nuclease subunit B
VSRSWYDLAPLEPYIEAGCVLLTPNFRLARRIKTEWDVHRIAAGDRVWEPLRVLPLESWLLQRRQEALSLGLVPPLQLLRPGQILELWQQTIAEEEQQSGSYHLLRPAASAQMCSQARDTLIRWQVDPADERIRQQFRFDQDCAAFLHWHDLFEQRLAAAAQITAPDCIRQLLDCAGDLPRSQAVLVEFDDIPPLYLNCARALCEQVTILQPGAKPGRQLAHGFDSKRSELQAVARWAATINRENPAATVGVVLTDMNGDRAALEYLLRREFGCLGGDYASLPVNFSTGISLERAPVIRDALAVLALGLRYTTVPAVVSLLQSRFLHLPDAHTELAGIFVSRLYADGHKQLPVSDLRYRASKIKLGEQQGLVIGEHLMAVSRMRELQQNAVPSAWVQRFTDVLESWGWPGAGPLDSLEYQQVELWYRTLEEFAASDIVSSALPYEAALQLLTRCCSRQMSQPQTADSNVQVLGPLEAAGLAFDYLWVCGMQAGAWPAPARPNPFIPHSLQRQHQMPHASAERERAYAETLLAQYSRSTPELHGSYSQQLDGVGELPSALLQGFSWEPMGTTGVVNPVWLEQWQGRALEYLDDDMAPVVAAEERAQIAGGSGLLEDQSQCPFRAFARRRLGVEPLGTFGVALSPAERGSILHDALYALWGEIGDHATLVALQGEGRARVIQRAVQAALEAVPATRRHNLGAGYWSLESQHLGNLLQDWLEVEQARTSFVVRQREQEVTLELQQLQIRLRVDRIDELPDGSRVIIDYKTGISKVQDWLGDRPARPQLLLYSIAEPETTGALAFAQLRSRDCRYVGLGEMAIAAGVQTDIGKVVRDRMDAADWAQLNECWKQNLARLAAEFVAGEAQVDPLSAASCTWCGLHSLCRIGLDDQVGPALGQEAEVGPI